MEDFLNSLYLSQRFVCNNDSIKNRLRSYKYTKVNALLDRIKKIIEDYNRKISRENNKFIIKEELYKLLNEIDSIMEEVNRLT